MTEIKQNNSNILIIGNGFDLNLGLKTSYNDFIESDDFKRLLNKNYFAQHLQSKYDLEKWIDIENELKNYSKRNSGISESFRDFEDNFYELSESLKSYLRKINYEEIDKNSHGYNLIKFLSNQKTTILDYNYTKSLEIIFENLDKKEKIKDIIKVHGSIEDNIIFGVEDNAQIKDKHVFLRKAFNENFKAINTNNLLKASNQIFIFGHSLGKTDHMYFSDFFSELGMSHTRNSGKKLYLYHYGKSGYKEVLMEIDSLTHNSLSIFKRNINFNTIT